jgi:hypothetical protein
MIQESNSEIQIETSRNEIESENIYIVQINSFKKHPGVVEFKTHPEYFVSWDEASRFIRSQPMETNKDLEIRYYIQELSKSLVPVRLVVSNVN